MFIEKTFNFDLPGRCFNVRVISDVLSRFFMFLIYISTLSLNDENCYETVDVM